MKKSVRLLAMLLCVLSITALLPTTVLAADVDEVKAVATVIINSFDKTTLQTNKTQPLNCYPGVKYYIKVSKNLDLYDKYGNYIKTVKVKKTQWFVKKSGSSKWTQIKSLNNKFTYTFKYTKKMNGNKYRCKLFFTYSGKNYYIFSDIVCTKTKK